MIQIPTQTECDAVLAEINAGDPIFREAHVLSGVSLVEENATVMVTSGGILVRLLLLLYPSQWAGVEFAIDQVCHLELPGIDLELRATVSRSDVALFLTRADDEYYIVGRRLFYRFLDKSCWGLQPYYVEKSPLDEDGRFIVPRTEGPKEQGQESCEG